MPVLLLLDLELEHFPYHQPRSVLRRRRRRQRRREVVVTAGAGLPAALLDVQPARVAHQAWRDRPRQQRPPSAVLRLKLPAQQVRSGAASPSRHLDRVRGCPVRAGLHRRIALGSQQCAAKRSIFSARVPAGNTHYLDQQRQEG